MMEERPPEGVGHVTAGSQAQEHKREEGRRRPRAQRIQGLSILPTRKPVIVEDADGRPDPGALGLLFAAYVLGVLATVA